MGAAFVLVAYLLSVFLRAESLVVYNPCSQYGYTPYCQYYTGQNLGYNPYSYQPQVSNLFSAYRPYYNNPVQNFLPQNYPINNYPSQFYPGQSYGAQNYPVQQNYQPSYAQYGNQSGNTPYPYATSTWNTTNNSTSDTPVQGGGDPYANLKVDIIDIPPEHFPYYKRFFNLEDNLYPSNIIDDNSVSGTAQQRYAPTYTVKTDSKTYNYSSIPQGVNMNSVQTKTHSFKRTFTVDPTKKENAVINLNFVNGEPVTTENPDKVVPYQEATVASEEPVPTTTESDEPSNVVSWF